MLIKKQYRLFILLLWLAPLAGGCRLFDPCYDDNDWQDSCTCYKMVDELATTSLEASASRPESR